MDKGVAVVLLATFLAETVSNIREFTTDLPKSCRKPL